MLDSRPRMLIGRVCIVLLVLWLSACPVPSTSDGTPCDASSPGAAPSAGDEGDEIIARLLTRQDLGDACERGGPRVVEGLRSLRAFPDAVVRYRALQCLDKPGEPDAVPFMLDQVSCASSSSGACYGIAQFTERRPLRIEIGKLARPQHIPDLLRVVDRCAGTRTGADMAWVVGAIGDAAAIEPLRQRLQPKRGFWDRFPLVAALANLGDEEARAEFARLPPSQLQRSFMPLHDIEDMTSPWLLPMLAKMLRGRFHLPAQYRVRYPDDENSVLVWYLPDYAVFQVARITGHSFSFDLRKVPFTSAQRKEVADYVETLLPR